MNSHGNAAYAAGKVAVALAAALLAPAAWGQLACMTSNCGQTTIPADCLNRATPSTLRVLMTSLLTFSPATPKIEPGNCIEWRSSGLVHSSSADPCPDDSLTSCATASPPTCLWDSGNVSAMGTPPATVCYYDPVVYPPDTGDGFYCRLHDSPAHTGTMHGTLQVTTPIALLVDKDLVGGNVVLSWSGGGIPGDLTYRVVRSNAGDPAFPLAGITTSNPDGGTTGTQFTDVGELANSTTRYYLVRNRQVTE